MGLLNRKKKEIEKPKATKSVSMQGGKVRLLVGLNGDYFSGSIEEARVFFAALHDALQEALRLEGAVASIYQGK